jgi:hypothetical protein
MSKTMDREYVVHHNLTPGATLSVSCEGFTSCQLQHFTNTTGTWVTFETNNRVRFRVAGVSYAANVTATHPATQSVPKDLTPSSSPCNILADAGT